MVIEQKKSIKKELILPGDKSISHRNIITAALANGVTEINGVLIGEDSVSTIECLRKMNVGIEILPNNRVKVFGRGFHGFMQYNHALNTTNSGTTIRILLGILSGQSFQSILTADDRGQKRSFLKVTELLRQMGANITSKNENMNPPLFINGTRLHGADINIANSGVQLKSSILFASLYAEGETTITEGIKSRDHTERVLETFGANILVQGNTIKSTKIPQLEAQNITVPGDVSSAAYFIAAALMVENSEIVIKNVGINPTRIGFVEVLRQMGGTIEIEELGLVNNEPVGNIVAKTSKLHGIEIDPEKVPLLIDEIAVIAVVGAFAEGTTTISIPQEALNKLSGRIRLIATELAKMGVKIMQTGDKVVIEGGRGLKGTVVESYNDERIAMALSIAGFVAEGETVVRRAQCIDVVFPEFFDLIYSF